MRLNQFMALSKEKQKKEVSKAIKGITKTKKVC